MYRKSRRAKTVLDDFTYQDIFVAHLPTLSLTPWTLSEDKQVIAEKLRKSMIYQLIFYFIKVMIYNE
jgi:hypothetical protein